MQLFVIIMVSPNYPVHEVFSSFCLFSFLKLCKNLMSFWILCRSIRFHINTTICYHRTKTCYHNVFFQIFMSIMGWEVSHWSYIQWCYLSLIIILWEAWLLKPIGAGKTTCMVLASLNTIDQAVYSPEALIICLTQDLAIKVCF